MHTCMGFTGNIYLWEVIMWENLYQTIIWAFLGEEALIKRKKRIKFRKALNFWCKEGGCLFLRIPRG